MKEIYSFILSKGVLTDRHRNELKTKRGFTDKTIDECRFFSGGQYLLKLEEEMRDQFNNEILITSGVFADSGKHIHLCKVLTDDRIVIPYLMKSGDCYLLRPHKFGLRGVQVQIYQDKNVTSPSIIVTEGEFKAAAAVQMGFSAVAVPGVSSFSGSNFERFVDFLNNLKVQDICFVFDNEVKDDPTFDNYRKNPADRYDTDYYAYALARRLTKFEGFNARIGHLPDGWRVKGKIDIDGALAQGRTSKDLQHVVDNARTFAQFRKELSDEAEKVFRRKEKKAFFRSNIKKEHGRYVAIRKTGDVVYDEEISNFQVKIKATHDTPAGIIRHVSFYNGENESRAFPIDSSPMSRSDTFAAFCLSKGDYIWSGKAKDLQLIWNENFLDGDGRVIHETDHVGWVDKEKMWVFQNVAFDKDGKELRPDDGIFWTEKRGIKPLAIDSGGLGEGLNVPALNTNKFDPNELRERLTDSIGFMEARLCLGWCFSVFFLEDVFKLCGCFPFLFLTGKTSSGKSHVAEWLMQIFGIETGGIQAEQTTAVGLQRYLSYYASLPVFMDEYRNNDKVTNKNGLIRNAYNRQVAIKGVKSDFGVRQAGVRGTMLITGQEGPSDNAIMTRCINVTVSANKRNEERNPFDWFTTNKSKFSNIAYQILKNKSELQKVFIEEFKAATHVFNKGLKIDTRKSINYAVVAAGHAVVFNNDDDFCDQVEREILRMDKEINREEESMVFWRDLNTMKSTGDLRKEFWVVESGGVAYFDFSALYAEWSKYLRATGSRDTFTEASLRSIIQNEKYYLNHECDSDGKPRRKFINNRRIRALAVSLHECPEDICELVGYEGGQGATSGPNTGPQ